MDPASCRVGVGWIRNSCRRCRFCMRGDENLCVNGYDGLIVGRECLQEPPSWNKGSADPQQWPWV